MTYVYTSQWRPRIRGIGALQFLIKWWNKIDEQVKITEIKEKIKQNNILLENKIQKELQAKNPLLKLKNSMQRKYPMMTEEELKKRYLQYMQIQLEQTFDSDNISLCSSKTSSKTMEELEKELNQDSDEEIPPDAQDPNPEENIDEYILQLRKTTKKK